MTEPTPDELVAAAAATCTPAELDSLAYAAAGISDRHAAHRLGVSRTTHRDRLKNAYRKVAAHLAQEPAAS